MGTATWLDITCRICDAPARKPCTSPSGAVLPHPHAARVKAAETPEAEQPAPPFTTPLLYGYTTNGTRAHIVSANNPGRSVCGCALSFVPTQQPTDPAVCTSCDRLQTKFGGAQVAPPNPHGVCPVCGAEETLDAGLIPAHQQMVVGKGGIRRSASDCAGKGHPPEVASEWPA